MSKNTSNRGLTLTELLLVVAIIGILSSLLLSVIVNQKRLTKHRLKYIQNRDALMAEASEVRWDYHEATNPSQDRRISEIYFDPSIQPRDLHFMWEIIEPDFHLRDRMMALRVLDFCDSEFQDHWMTNMIGVYRGFPYRLEGLRSLAFDYTPISDKGIAFLYKYDPSIQQNKHQQVEWQLMKNYPMTNLVQISLLGCRNITRKGVGQLKKAIPGIVVITDWDPHPPGQL